MFDRTLVQRFDGSISNEGSQSRIVAYETEIIAAAECLHLFYDSFIARPVKPSFPANVGKGSVTFPFTCCAVHRHISEANVNQASWHVVFPELVRFEESLVQHEMAAVERFPSGFVNFYEISYLG